MLKRILSMAVEMNSKIRHNWDVINSFNINEYGEFIYIIIIIMIINNEEKHQRELHTSKNQKNKNYKRKM